MGNHPGYPSSNEPFLCQNFKINYKKVYNVVPYGDHGTERVKAVFHVAEHLQGGGWGGGYQFFSNFEGGDSVANYFCNVAGGSINIFRCVVMEHTLVPGEDLSILPRDISILSPSPLLMASSAMPQSLSLRRGA